ELIERFDLDRCGHSGSIFDFSKLDHLNSVRIKAMKVEELVEHLKPYISGSLAELSSLRSLVELVRDEIAKLSDFERLAKPILDSPSYADDILKDESLKNAKAVIATMAEVLTAMTDPLDRELIKAKIKEAGKSAGVKGKELFMPIRAALTGSLHGPALDGVIAVLGREECLNRLRGFPGAH
ncbi:hypothetical protein HY256_12540, partial [Candidatus Sumerlaeota bacterium]|nr:hypothetical protein [Candidatus Sumerlaeota bacterium]